MVNAGSPLTTSFSGGSSVILGNRHNPPTSISAIKYLAMFSLNFEDSKRKLVVLKPRSELSVDGMIQPSLYLIDIIGELI